MVLLDRLGRRMALTVLWELSIVHAALTFRELQAAAGTNPSVLNTRLKQLREARLIMRSRDGYRLTDAGLSLTHRMLQLQEWANN
jgi:DNA-binding HxlR family transcriptional regulator